MEKRLGLELGARRLGTEWRALLTSATSLREDAVAGLSVALLAVPLSLAIALASDVPPAVGLTTAIVAGVIGALAGGTRLAVTGPAAAMAVLVGTVVERHGLAGLVVVTVGAGLLQVLAGVLKVGRIARMTPLPVIEGFTAGIGAIILIGQLPRALGLRPPEESHVIDVITHIGELLHETNIAALGVAMGSLAICLAAPRIHRRLPGPLFAVVLPSLTAGLLGLDLPSIGAIPSTLPAPSWPAGMSGIGALWGPILMVFGLGSLESLLSAAAVDKLAKGPRHHPDQELIGQGFANVAAGLFGGMPATGVIARSALNVAAGGKTRRSALLHALFVLIMVMGAAPLLARIPIAALAGVLISVALRMLNPSTLRLLFRTSRPDAAVFLITFFLMVMLDLLEGVQWGLGAAFVVAAIWSRREQLLFDPARGSSRIVLEGSMTFLSAIKLEALRERVQLLPAGEPIVLELSHVSHVDASGAEQLVELASGLIDAGREVYLVGMREDVRDRVLSFDAHRKLAERVAETESALLDEKASMDGRARLSIGVERYRRNHRAQYAALFKRLAKTQAPHTLFISCADSRIVPNLITSTDPGELFILRNVGNMIPPYSKREAPASGAGVEYAVGVLEVTEVVVCAHSRCGAIAALRDPSRVPASLVSLHAWLEHAAARKMCERVPATVHDDDVARLNALAQLDNLRTYAIVRERESKGLLRLSAWFFDIATGNVEGFDPITGRWAHVELEEPRPAAAMSAEVLTY